VDGFRQGSLVDGRYQVEEVLARGGMAEVFLARDVRLGRPVALKVLATRLSSDESFVARFRREAQAAAALSHPNIVPVFDWGEAQGSYFIAMEYVPGRTLAELITDEAPLSAERTALIGAQIAAALAAAHRHGVVHRDIKPANVIIGAEGTVKVTDFGIAHLTAYADSRLTATGTVLGTPAYLSPEQAEGRAIDGRADLYSLGVVLYELATGTLPFRGESTPALVQQHVFAPLEPPRLRNPAVPATLAAVITEALAKDPDDRPQSAEQFEGRLRALTARETSSELPTEVAATRILRRPGGRRAWAFPAVLAGVVAAAGFLLAYGLESQSAPRAGTGTTGTTGRSSTRSHSTSTTAATTTTTPPATRFAGYQVVAGSGADALFCPDGVPLGKSGKAGAAAGGRGPGSGVAGGQGGQPGCGSNGGAGGKGGKGAPRAAGGKGGNGGNGGCQPDTLAQMQHGARPCDGSGSDGGKGGDGGDAAPGIPGGAGGAGGSGGQTTNAKGGAGGKGGDSKPGRPGGNGGPGQPGGGANGTTSGLNGEDGTPGANALGPSPSRTKRERAFRAGTAAGRPTAIRDAPPHPLTARSSPAPAQ
jgi:serine/threonine protein kinase